MSYDAALRDTVRTITSTTTPKKKRSRKQTEKPTDPRIPYAFDPEKCWSRKNGGTGLCTQCQKTSGGHHPDLCDIHQKPENFLGYYRDPDNVEDSICRKISKDMPMRVVKVIFNKDPQEGLHCYTDLSAADQARTRAAFAFIDKKRKEGVLLEKP